MMRLSAVSTANREIKTMARPITAGEWITWKLSPDSDKEERFIVTTADGETEICGIVYNETDAAAIAAVPKLIETLETLRADFELLKNGEWDGCEDGCIASIELIDAAMAKVVQA